jgi:tetratricopeptide (TPR) repeat protein
VLGQLGNLVDQSLLRLDESVEEGQLRLDMLETIRAYGLERLAASGEETDARRRHAAWYLALAETAEPQLLGPEQVTWLARMELERDNLRAALGWAREQGEMEIGLRIAGALWRFWHLHGHTSEGRAWLEALLAPSAADGQAAVATRAKALRSAGGLAYFQGNYEDAWECYDESRRLYDALGDRENCVGARHNLGIVLHAQGEYARAEALYEESLMLARGLENESSVIAALLVAMGNLARQRGGISRARAYLEEALTLRRVRGDAFGIAISLIALGGLLREQGDTEQALTSYRESLALSGPAGYVQPMSQCLEGIAGIAMAQGQAERAARLAGAAATLRQQSGMSLDPEERADFDQTVAAARAALGDDAFTAAWIQGQALHAEQALVFERSTRAFS